MDHSQLFLSTIGSDCFQTASTYGLGLEIAEFCTASNMDSAAFPQLDQKLRQGIHAKQPLIFHAPFNELFPCAIDPKARELAAFRYRQSIALAQDYGANKVVIHGGYHPQIYFPIWYVEQSIQFWRAFFATSPGIQIVLENVMEPEMDWLPEIIRSVDNPDFRMCLDIGHVNIYSGHSPLAWLESCHDCISHFHIHNNDRSWDTHSALDQGCIPMEEFLISAQELCPAASYTLELTDAHPSVRWLLKKQILKGGDDFAL